MNQLRNVLNKQYRDHYLRVNLGSIEPENTGSIRYEGFHIMCGDLITSLAVGSRILDLGCGTGFFLQWLSKQANIVPMGVDVSPTQVEIAKKSLPDTEIICEDGLSFLREHPKTFAGIFTFDLLEHIPGDDLCLEWIEAALDALKPTGFFYCRVPNAANITSCFTRYIDLTHVRLFTSASILQLLQAGGFRNCRIIPYRSNSLKIRVRVAIEHLLHRMLFKVAGRGLSERNFTVSIYAVGFKNG
jgi:2-polyprenyl-3-methyl-5-hydroxy-6-metoxy-1,4-benzoquinol methylase